RKRPRSAVRGRGTNERLPVVRVPHGDEAVGANHDVIEDLYAYKVAGMPKTLRERSVLGRGFGIARGVIVNQDDGGRVREQGEFKDFTGMEDRRRKRADRDHVKAQDLVAPVEREHEEDLAVGGFAAGAEDVEDVLRGPDARGAAVACCAFAD